MKSGLIKVMGVVALLSLAAAPATANIYLDENFEDASPFTNLGYPEQGGATVPDASQIASTQGVNVRAVDNAPASLAPLAAFSNTGTVSTTYAYSGAQSLKLASGQSFAVVGDGAYVYPAQNWYNVIQLAVAVDEATLALPSTTQVGHIALNYSTDGTAAPAELVFRLNLVRNSTGGVDVIVQNNGAKAGEITAAGEWGMISLLAQKDTQNPENWECWDPNTLTYKGPQPTGDPFNGSGTYASLTNGIWVFVNSNTAGAHLDAATLGNNWAWYPPAGVGEEGNQCNLLNWEVAAENSGTVYVDEVFWGHGMWQTDKGVDINTQESAARMNAFELPPPPPTTAGSWTLYNE